MPIQTRFRARPARLRSRLCPRMGWGSWEERAGALAGRAPPLPDSAPAVRAQRAGRRSTDAPRSRWLAGLGS
ncbi:Ethanolamine Kinase 2 [Manis pentadactyla]|nr:Ethanolamine Kinase 2 [Manis pentadactyla]